MLDIHACLAKEPLHLGLAERILIRSGIQDDNDVVAWHQPILPQAPDFSSEPPGAVA